jgi:hypothetical protein
MSINIKSIVLLSATTIGVAGFLAIPAAEALPMVPLDPGCGGDNVLWGDYCYPGAQAGPPPPPTVSFEPGLGTLTAHITDHSGVASKCTYNSDLVNRGFSLPANSTFDLRIVPAIPANRNWDVSVSCDNGASTQTSTFF